MEGLTVKIENGESEGCLVCSNLCDNPLQSCWWMDNFKSLVRREEISENECLSSHLLSVFILRKVLNYPKSECEDLLRRMAGVNPGEWFELCLDCSEVVEKVVESLQQIVQLEMRIASLKELVGDKLKANLSYKENVTEEEEVVASNISARNIIRRHFRTCNATLMKAFEVEESLLTSFEYDSQIADTEPLIDADTDEDFSPTDNSGDDETFEIETDSKRKRRQFTKKANSGHLTCDICGKNPPTEYALRMHMYRFHKEIYFQRKLGYRSFTGRRKSSRRQKSVNAHFTNLHSSVNSLVQLTPDGTSTTEPSQVNPLPDYSNSKEKTSNVSCDICGKSSKTEYALRMHMYRFHKETYLQRKLGHLSTSFQCLSCPKTFRKQGSFNAHVKNGCDPDNISKQTSSATSTSEPSQVNPLPENVSSLDSKAKPSKMSCDICGKPTATEYAFRMHMYRFHKETYMQRKLGYRRPRFECSLCSKSFRKQHSLKAHIINFHNLAKSEEQETSDGTSTMLPSQVSSLPENDSSLNSSSRPSKTSCDICGKPTATEYAFRMHMYRFHKETYMQRKLGHRRPRLILKCSFCSKSFRRRDTLNAHIINLHNLAKSGEQGTSETSIVTFHCSMCDVNVSCSSNREKENHEAQHKVIDNVVTRIAEENTFTCNLCSKTFPTLKQIYLHVKKNHSKEVGIRHKEISFNDRLGCLRVREAITSNSEVEFKCNFCSKTYPTLRKACEHVRSMHRERLGFKKIQRKYRKCPHCEKSFVSESVLKSHVKIVHDQIRDVFCDKCGQGFTNRAHFDVHHASFHSEKEPVICDICGKTATSKRALYTHMRRYHQPNIGKEKWRIGPRKCFHCGLEAAHSTALGKHMREFHQELYIHQCSSCPQKFVAMWGLLAHERQKHSSAK